MEVPLALNQWITTKNRLKRRKKVHHLPDSCLQTVVNVERSERIHRKRKFSTNTMAFIIVEED